MTYREILSEAGKLLYENGITEYENDAWLLLEHIFGIKRYEYFMKLNDTVSDEELMARYGEVIAMRATHIPVQYITGTQEFMGLIFRVDENVLIPRQDTEVLVERALKIIKDVNSQRRTLDSYMSSDSSQGAIDEIRVLDMCTGSGCIAISVYKHANVPVQVTAVDISPEALKIAKGNALSNDAKDIKFIESNLFEKINENICGKNSNECGTMGAYPLYDVIISNPPYIPSEVVKGLMPEVRDHEPHLALDGTEDGLEFYRRITEESIRYIKDGGYLLYEIGCEQGEAVRTIMMANGYENVDIIKDLAGLDRVVVGRAKITI